MPKITQLKTLSGNSEPRMSSETELHVLAGTDPRAGTRGRSHDPCLRNLTESDALTTKVAGHAERSAGKL